MYCHLIHGLNIDYNEKQSGETGTGNRQSLWELLGYSN